MAHDCKEASKLRQERYVQRMKEFGFKKVQVYLSPYEYRQLVEMRDNKKKTFSEIISAGINAKYRYWQKYRIYK